MTQYKLAIKESVIYKDELRTRRRYIDLAQ